jgi:hypothetical protein
VAWEPSLWQSTVLSGRFWQWPLSRVKRVFAARFRARMDTLGIAHTDVFFGTVSAGRVDLRRLRRFLAAEKGVRNHLSKRLGKLGGNVAQKVPDTFSVVEIGLHPGEKAEAMSPEDRANGWHDPLAALRPNELQMVSSAELPAFLGSVGWRFGRLGT